MEIQLHAFLALAVDGRDRSASRSHYFRGKHPRQPSTEDRVSPQASLGTLSRPTPKLTTILAELSRLRTGDNLNDNSQSFHYVMCSGPVMRGNLSSEETSVLRVRTRTELTCNRLRA